MSMWDIEFYEYSMIADDPKKLEKLKNYVFDPEYDEWLNEVDDELNGRVKEVEKFHDYSEYEVLDDNVNENGDLINENTSSEENDNQGEKDSILDNSEQQEITSEDEFAPLYDGINTSFSSREIDDWEEVN